MNSEINGVFGLQKRIFMKELWVHENVEIQWHWQWTGKPEQARRQQ